MDPDINLPFRWADLLKEVGDECKKLSDEKDKLRGSKLARFYICCLQIFRYQGM
jgi:hypothetical protein